MNLRTALDQPPPLPMDDADPPTNPGRRLRRAVEPGRGGRKLVALVVHTAAQVVLLGAVTGCLSLLPETALPVLAPVVQGIAVVVSGAITAGLALFVGGNYGEHREARLATRGSA